jgi:hypothetical protein
MAADTRVPGSKGLEPVQPAQEFGAGRGKTRVSEDQVLQSWEPASGQKSSGIDDRHDGPRDQILVLADVERDHGLDIGRELGAIVSRGDASVQVHLDRFDGGRGPGRALR